MWIACYADTISYCGSLEKVKFFLPVLHWFCCLFLFFAESFVCFCAKGGKGEGGGGEKRKRTANGCSFLLAPRNKNDAVGSLPNDT